MARHILVVMLILLTVQIVHAQEQPLDATVSWLGNSFGGADNAWVQNFVEGMFVTPDGTVFVNSGWDEGGGEASAYRDGQHVGQLGGNHGWGRYGGQTITADDAYVYVAMQQSGCDGGDDSLNMNGLNSYPPCDDEGAGPVWFGIRRYDRSSLTPIPFSAGYGYDGTQLVVDIVDGSEDDIQPISGLAIYENELFVAISHSNSIKVYSTETLELLREFAVQQPDEIAVSATGKLWILQREQPSVFGVFTGIAHVVCYSRQGDICPQQISFDPATDPTALAFDHEGQLLITDNGIRQQVLFYGKLDTEPSLVDTIGVEGGVFSGVAGQIAPLKFYDLRGVGVDAGGNVYIGMGNYASGTHLQSYTPDGTLRWELQGLFFVDSVGIDPTSDGTIVYGKHERFGLDYSITTPGAQATYAAYTLNPFKYPDDIRNQWSPTDVFVQYIDGVPFLYMTDMYASYIAVYRFNAQTDGDIAIPAALFVKEPNDPTEQGVAGEPTTGAWIWRDANGNGGFDAGEYDVQPDPQDSVYTWGWWVDSEGTVWRANREEGIRQFPVQGMDEHGNPIYTFSSSIFEQNPAPFNEDPAREYHGDINRLLYYPATDTLYLTGYTADYPNDFNEWGQIGRVVVRYDGWSTGDRQPDWELAPAWSEDSSPTGIELAGDYLFLAYTNPEPAYVAVYDIKQGEFTGRMTPNATVGDYSGWFDIRHPLRAVQRANGEYIIFAEEDGRAKNLVYRWMP
ncbi:MAG: hypothetical protein H7Y11_08885 [Armatimonadetes bacterium]|nr:hypothetical protein [Anaerolineae bacterium]